MVQIAAARIKNDETGQFEMVSARDYDEEKHSGKTCHCPDPNCPAVLTRYGTYEQTFYDFYNFNDDGTPKTYTVKIAEHYKRKAKTVDHAEHCTALDPYAKYQAALRREGAKSLGNGVFTLRLNIITDDKSAPLRWHRPPPNLAEAFALVNNNGSEEHKERTPRPPMSKGLNNVKLLAGLLDETQFNADYRRSVLLFRGNDKITLADLYKDDPVKFFREMHARAKEGMPPQPTLIHFKPIPISAYHSKQDHTIQGYAKPIHGKDGNVYHVSVKLHCGDKAMYDDMIKSIKESGERSFLVYSTSAYVNLFEFAQKKKDITNHRAKDNAVFVHVPVKTAAQICVWEPISAQLDLDFSKKRPVTSHDQPRMAAE